MSFPVKVFPVGSNKRPMIKHWQERATDDLIQIARWRRQDGARALGIPTGATNGLFVIDLDVDQETGARAGEASLAKLGTYAELIGKAKVQTPSGGAHIYLRPLHKQVPFD